jgi:hypothetical protein
MEDPRQSTRPPPSAPEILILGAVPWRSLATRPGLAHLDPAPTSEAVDPRLPVGPLPGMRFDTSFIDRDGM